MDEKTYNERVKRLREVDKVVKSLDSTIREASFKILQSYITGGKVETGKEPPEHDISDDDFFTQFDHDKPADNALLIAAYHYRQYGTQPISLGEVRTLADDVGITIPERVDMTFKAAQRSGKNLFASAGIGKIKPTVYGEKFFKETYRVTKGKKKKEEKATES